MLIILRQKAKNDNFKFGVQCPLKGLCHLVKSKDFERRRFSMKISDTDFDLSAIVTYININAHCIILQENSASMINLRFFLPFDYSYDRNIMIICIITLIFKDVAERWQLFIDWKNWLEVTLSLVQWLIQEVLQLKLPPYSQT